MTGQFKHLSAGVVLLATIIFTTAADAQVDSPIKLTDVTSKTGIAFRHTDGGSGKRYVVETVSAGVATFDYDGDGDMDIYFLNGAPLKGTKADSPPTNALYRNDGNFKFTDVTVKAGVGDRGYGLGLCAGDYDNDGDQDLYLNNFGANVLYNNNGDGTFTDVTKKAGVANGDKVGAGACFLDIDADGDLDLYVANYLKFSYADHTVTRIRGVPVYRGPTAFKPEPDTLYRNNGDGTFTDVSKPSGIAKHASWGMGVVCADYDNDGDTDVFVANDVSLNYLFQNDGKGKFEEVGLIAGVAVDSTGEEQGSMGVDCGDYNNDGRLDFHQTSYEKQLAVLFRNLGAGSFEDSTLVSRAGLGTLAKVTWGDGFVDFDNDGDRDIFIACGHLQDNVEKYDDTMEYHAKNVLLMNASKGLFANVSAKSGNGMAVKLSSRGAAFSDLDNDGDIDAVILNSRREPTILRNDSPAKNHWLQIRLKGVKTNRDGVGARVKVVSGKLTQIDEVHSGRGYQSHYGMRMHFGLGKLDKIDRVEVRWIGGGADVLKNVRVDQVLKIAEGSSKSSP
ncbi:MAG: CRTAC1 family protein [Phycisphaerae bacterium]|jgi:hypothetical protein|nr:CRTAC1 family protein [Phycisphaerae bacterium]